MRRLALPLAALLGLAACGPRAAETVVVDHAWVRLAAAPGRPAAAYFTILGGAQPDRLVAVESPQVKTIELHAGGMHGGMMTMRPMAGADIARDATVAFAPEGDHAMLFDVDPAVKPGGTLPLSFRFQSGARVEVAAKAVAAGDEAPTS